jgi:hypothetical protein
METTTTIQVEKTEALSSKPKTTDSSNETAVTDNFIYIGPGVPGGALSPNKIFKGTRKEIETLLSDIFEKYPAARSLLVPVSKLASIRVKTKTTDNVIGKNYAELKALFAKGV